MLALFTTVNGLSIDRCALSAQESWSLDAGWVLPIVAEGFMVLSLEAGSGWVFPVFGGWHILLDVSFFVMKHKN